MRIKSEEDSGDEIIAGTTPIAVAVPVTPNDGSQSAPLAMSEVATATIVMNRPDTLLDDEAYAISLSAQERGIADIRQHCVQHLSHNPSSSFVTWIATLHPENAQLTIDPRFLIPDNPWSTVYEEVKENLQNGKGAIAAVPTPSAPHLDDIMPEDVPVEGQGDKESDASSTTYRGCLDLFISRILIFVCILASIVIELMAGYAYFSYSLCGKIIDKCSPVGAFSWLPLSIAWILRAAFCFMDIVLHCASVLVVEWIAVVNYILCTIFACSPEVGKNVHQMTRKLPHHVRWAVRRRCNCTRVYFKKDETTNASNSVTGRDN